MMEDKNLDRLFQEQLKNLEAKPLPRVWNAIEGKLQKKKRRVVPIWWLSGGVAATLIIGLLIFSTSKDKILKDKIEKNPLLISTPKKDFENTLPETQGSDTLFNIYEEKTIIAEEKIVPKKSKSTNFKQQKDKNNEGVLIANTIYKNKEKGKRNAQKKAMEKTFFREHGISEKKYKNTDSIKRKETFIAENVLEEKKKETLKNEIKTRKEVIAQNEDIHNSIKEEETLEIKDVTKKTWTVTPVVAVLNANSFSNTSPVDKSLGNSTEGNNTYSYGIKVAYQVAPKLTFQSGIHIQEMSFSNREVIIIPTNSSTSNVVLDAPDNFSFGESAPDISTAGSSLNSSLEGNLNQKYGYIEVPMEIKYQVLENKKFNTQLVAGFSSLILNKNQIEINTATDSKTGKVDNLNSLNFSGNLGLDFNYVFQQNWSLHINPMFKAQLNTFTRNANGFKPYFIGVYTGINYRF